MTQFSQALAATCLATLLASVTLGAAQEAHADDYSTLPMPDRDWTGPYQKELTARALRKALRAVPLFDAPAPDKPTPQAEDNRWCKRAGAVWAIVNGCYYGTLDPDLCARAHAAKSTDEAWFRALQGHAFDRERECRDAAFNGIDELEEK